MNKRRLTTLLQSLSTALKTNKSKAAGPTRETWRPGGQVDWTGQQVNWAAGKVNKKDDMKGGAQI